MGSFLDIIIISQDLIFLTHKTAGMNWKRGVAFTTLRWQSGTVDLLYSLTNSFILSFSDSFKIMALFVLYTSLQGNEHLGT